MNSGYELAKRLNDFYKDYDFYDYRDGLDGAEEDAVEELAEQLEDSEAVSGILDSLLEIQEDGGLSEEQTGILKELLEDVSLLMEEKKMENNAFVVLLVEPGKRPSLAVLDGSLEDMQRIVGGNIEQIMPFEDEVALICNAEAKLFGETLNRAIRDADGQILDVIAGPFFVCYAPVNSERYLSLPEELVHKYADVFAAPELFYWDMDGIRVVRDGTAVQEYLGVKWQMYSFENGVDIELIDSDGNTAEWHTVGKDSEEFKGLEEAAKEFAGKLALSMAKEKTEALGVVNSLHVGLSEYIACVKSDAHLEALRETYDDEKIVGLLKERLDDTVVAKAVIASLQDFIEKGPAEQAEKDYLGEVVASLNLVVEDEDRLCSLLKGSGLSFDDLGLVIRFENGDVGHSNGFYGYLIGYVMENQKGLDAVLGDAVEKSHEGRDNGVMIDILQVKRGDDYWGVRFEPLRRVKGGVDGVSAQNYDNVYRYSEPSGVSLADECGVMRLLEDVYRKFNLEHPEDFRGHSLSVSDIVILTKGKESKVFYCDSIGFQEMPDKFVKEFCGGDMGKEKPFVR